MDCIINVNNIKFSYKNTEDDTETLILDNISLDIKKGEFLAVLGHNGSGKSTLAKHLNAILVPNEGSVKVLEYETDNEDNLFNIRQHVGMVFQNPDNQIVATIVEEDVAFALENMGVEPTEMRERVDEALKSVGMYEYRHHSPSQLSGGQKQRVAIAGIIAMRPDCIVLDEPTAMLDPKGRREVLKTIRKLNKDFGITIVLITHYMDEAAKADRIVVVDKGSVILDDIPENVFSNVTLMKEIGLDVPQVTELMFLLKKQGIDADTHITNEEKCVEYLAKLLSRRI